MGGKPPPPNNKACALLARLATIDIQEGQEKLSKLINGLVHPSGRVEQYLGDGSLKSLLDNCQKGDSDISTLEFYQMVNLIRLACHLNQ